MFIRCLKNLVSFSFINVVLLTSLLFQPQANAQVLTPTRASSFTDNAQGLLLTETIEPDSPQGCLVTTYGYDGYGNKSSINTADHLLEFSNLT